MKKIFAIFADAVPVLLMIGFIPFVQNDYALIAIYIVVIVSAFAVKHERYDAAVFLFGFFAMIASEYLFISTGVEVFARRTLFGLMPLWLPFLWGYGFVAIKRSVVALN